MHGIPQIIVIIVVLLFNLYVFHALRKELIEYQYALVWIAAGIVMLVFSIYPPLIDNLAKLIGIGLSLNLLFFFSILFLLLISFRICLVLSNLKRRIYTLTQHIAILEKKIDSLSSKD